MTQTKLRWQDTSSFREHETDRTPRRWTLRLGPQPNALGITISRWRRTAIGPPGWYLTCEPWFTTPTFLADADVDELQAKHRALDLVDEQLRVDRERLQSFGEEMR